MAAVPSQPDALADFIYGNISADSVDDAGDFVARHAGIGNAGKEAEFCKAVAVTNSAGLHANAHMPRTGLGKFTLHQFKRTFGSSYLKGTTGNTRHGLVLLRGWM
jgi:hypothetical protein